MLILGRDPERAAFYDSLGRFGILALGNKETLRFTDFEDKYEVLDAREKIFRRLA